MAIGPGKYDDLATTVIKAAHARGVVVIVFDGDKGNGFSVQADAQVAAILPDVLRYMAEQLEDDLTKKQMI